MIWTREVLHDLIEKQLSDYKFIVVSNREPYIHQREDGISRCLRPASGMATAIDPIMRSSGGTWIAHGSGNADREYVDPANRLRVPPEDPQYTLRRVWVDDELHRGFYDGLANGGIWPLCHVTFTRPVFNPQDWSDYQQVNQIFADAVLEEVGDEPGLVFIQDYHFCLLPRILKKANRKIIIAQFWHIPWPNREVFRVFPWGEELLDGLLGNDLLGFHIHYHCQNFLDTVDRSIEAMVNPERYEIVRGGRTTQVRPFPISIDFEEHNRLAQSPEVEAAMADWRSKLRLEPQHRLAIGIERMDYTKGIPERLQGIDYLLTTHPEYRERIRFVQVAAPTRPNVAAYRRLQQEVRELVRSINERHATARWKPIEWIGEHHNRVSMMALHRLAECGIINSLHDGMNLVAKEFVASRSDENGVLVLSRFTGAARELTSAIQINPFSLAEIGESIHQAFTMSAEEQSRRMSRMREVVAKNNIYRWAGKVLSTLLKFDFPEPEGDGA